MDTIVKINNMPSGVYPHKKGQDHHFWKGDKIGYSGIHKWIKRVYGSPQRCDACGSSDDPKTIYDWANISGKYIRDKSDWKRLCRKCHKQFDGQYGENVKSARLNKLQVKVIKYALKLRVRQKNLATIFNVAPNTISAIKRGVNWKHIII